MHRRRGFTLIELLVVIAIIGLLSTIAIVAMSTARAKARDSRRTADLRAVQNALELYRSSEAGYPDDRTAGASGSEIGIGLLEMLTSEGWVAAAGAGATVYLLNAPEDPAPGGTGAYTYISETLAGAACDATPCDSYTAEFKLEQGTGGLAAGTYCATPPATITSGAC